MFGIQETANWQIADLRDYVTGEEPITFEADSLPVGLTLLSTGQLLADGSQVEGQYTVQFRAQNAAIAPQWVPALPSNIVVVPAPIAPQSSTLPGKYGLGVTIGIGIGTSFNAAGFP